MMRNLINTLWSKWKTVEGQIEELDEELETDLRCRCRLHTHPADSRYRPGCGDSNRCGDR